MSLSATKNNFLLHESSSLNDISERSPKLFFDDLLIPSLPPQSKNHKISKTYSYISRSAPATIIGKTNKSNSSSILNEFKNSQKFSSYLPPILSENIPQKYNTAPASPQHMTYSERSSFITPTSSPGRSNYNNTGNQLSAQLILTRNHMINENSFSNVTHLNHFPLPNENYNKMNKNLTLLNQLNKSIINSTKITPPSTNESNIGLNLPSLKHLKLLPNPKVQENSYIYPDTSETTPIWKRNLVAWCQRESGDDYGKIQDKIRLENNQMTEKLGQFTSNYKNLSESYLNEQTNFNEIPSVLKPQDTFQKLTNKGSSLYKIPVTPPMSPKRHSIEKNDHISDNGITRTEVLKFSPFVSDKLVQLVKKEQKKLEKKNTTTTNKDNNINNNNNNGHKKTNSFKALQIKNLLDNRDILSKTSKKVTKKGRSNSAGRNHFYASSTLSSPSSIIIGTKAKQLVMKLDQNNNNSSSSSDSDNSNDSSKTNRQLKKRNSSKSRSRSISPIRRAAGSMTPPTPNYHKFSVESPPQSPTRSSPSINITSLSPAKQTHNGNKANSTHKKHSHHTPHAIRTCVSCHSSDSPCWRPSWSHRKQDQLCNSCGLRYKKTHTRCLNDNCRKIPTKGELNIMKSNGIFKDYVNGLEGTTEGYRCLFCNTITETTQA
ncbi:DNA-binding transcription repressor ASH1 [Maudiozyma barnettii]|uniref:Similar to Saccharomyces cerevisiae YKL185W ASH1 Zinc-finger inhibitor of HO transcription n=1 Tax=Maudiozyma barnettii TaxID=61262 RepID=A0A8H2VJN3_9SACH|nr:DNA-binding transcription repressor ASH1 [Kazachstania barnettii]CAB4256991.1 similar to Saccharomyces cerevisiae YKL185W ASH1 Zinc-finger inhibitor of HO transcription [Kazachstania barnettii]